MGVMPPKRTVRERLTGWGFPRQKPIEKRLEARAQSLGCDNSPERGDDLWTGRKKMMKEGSNKFGPEEVPLCPVSHSWRWEGEGARSRAHRFFPLCSFYCTAAPL